MSARTTLSEELSSARPSFYVPNQSGFKRQRVVQACQSCRKRKSKCDGQQPVCGRCEGYGHTCVWADIFKRSSYSLPSINIIERRMSNASTDDDEPTTASTIRTASSLDILDEVRSYDKLVTSMLQSVHGSSHIANFHNDLVRIRSRLPQGVLEVPATEPGTGISTPRPALGGASAAREEDHDLPATESTESTCRYLGEISDVSFYHAVKQVFNGEAASSTSVEASIPSYDQGEAYRQESYKYRAQPCLPPRDEADAYLDIYFSSVHIAYPFICKPLFMARYEKFWARGATAGNDPSLITLLYIIFAIGAYYNSFPSQENVRIHKYVQYFEYAARLSSSTLLDCSLNNIQVLLAQCVFLLATSQTDKCWNILGLAVRIAQAVGLHVEDWSEISSTKPDPKQLETKRRTWYTMYNLDRLLALQLGRPVTIHEGDFNVQIPSKAEDNYSGPSPAPNTPGSLDQSSSIDFFIHVIKFSEILSQVISDLYKPCQTRIDSQEVLANTSTLNNRILAWRLGLPRHLRFDKAHTFERSVVFRRQRNMLAIKFHHIRALIHRPYLRLSWLQRISSPQNMLLQSPLDQVAEMERTCISEAQHTAYLLHNVTDERSLVQDFPWWQMISCLLCASSILFVASTCIDPTEVDAELRSQTLSEDAETCLQVFEALSINSSAARRARDMLQSLKQSCISRRGTSQYRVDSTPSNINELNTAYSLISESNERTSSINTNTSAENADTMQDQSNQQWWNWNNNSNNYAASAVPGWLSWPVELSDSMMWSSQFLDAGSANISYNEINDTTMGQASVTGDVVMDGQDGSEIGGVREYHSPVRRKAAEAMPKDSSNK